MVSGNKRINFIKGMKKVGLRMVLFIVWKVVRYFVLGKWLILGVIEID